MNQLFETDIQSGAAFSPCRRYRYALWREWDTSLHSLVVIGLNPSTADETADDPTIRRCIGFAKRWNLGGLTMLNLFAFRSTDPKGLIGVDDPVGPRNDEHLFIHSGNRPMVLAAWGAPTIAKPRARAVAKLLESIATLHCLGTNADGSPKHPLYIKGDTLPVEWKP